MSMSGGPIQGDYSGTGAIVCSSVFFVVCTIVVALRFHAKSYTKSAWGWDDYLLIPSLFFSLSIFAMYIYMLTNTGGGHHIQDVRDSDAREAILFSKLSLTSIVCLCFSLTLPRIAIFIFYLRILTNKLLRKITWVFIILAAVVGTVSLIITLTTCIPLSAMWDKSIKDSKCLNEQSWWAYSTIPVVVFDLATMVLPISTIIQLQQPIGERLALLFTFLACGFGTIAEIARIVVFNMVNIDEDATWVFVPLCYATCCECGTYLIAACIPGLRPLWLHYRGRGPVRQSSQLDTLEHSARNNKGITQLRRDDTRYRLDSLKNLTSSHFTAIEGHRSSPRSSSESLRPNEIKITRGFEVA